jgi:hypothetical protein
VSGRALGRRYGHARRRATPAESRRNYATLVEQLLVRDYGFRPGEAAVSVQNFGSLCDQMHDDGDFPSNTALRIARFENEESVIPRRAGG